MRTLTVDRCITGPIRTRQNGLIETLTVTDSVLQGLPSRAGPGADRAARRRRDVRRAETPPRPAVGPGSPASSPRRQPPPSPAHADGTPSLRPTSSSSSPTCRPSSTAPLIWSAARFADRPLRASTLAAAQAAADRSRRCAALNRQLLAEAYPLALADAALAPTPGWSSCPAAPCSAPPTCTGWSAASRSSTTSSA